MKTIWKFPLPVADQYVVKTPKGAEILTVQRQGDQACLWAIVDTNADTVARVFEIHGTEKAAVPTALQFNAPAPSR